MFIIQHRQGQLSRMIDQRRTGPMRGNGNRIHRAAPGHLTQPVQHELPKRLGIMVRIRPACRHLVGASGNGNLFSGCQIHRQQLGVGLANINNRNVPHDSPKPAWPDTILSPHAAQGRGFRRLPKLQAMHG